VNPHISVERSTGIRLYLNIPAEQIGILAEPLSRIDPLFYARRDNTLILIKQLLEAAQLTFNEEMLNTGNTWKKGIHPEGLRG
jgi:hypothetical protein